MATKTFGAIVRERRKLRDLTQAELARRVGCATITIRKIEADSYRPSEQIANRLIMALKIPSAEKEAFIRLARASLQKRAVPSPLPSPPPLAAEIGLTDLSGRAIRSYELGERIGQGGFGAVYLAMQPFVKREVAIKIILPKYANHPQFIRRFETEARLIAHLEHPHIVPLYDYWREPDGAYLVMRLLRGGNLATRLAGQPLTLPTATQWIFQIGSALHTAHKLQIVHRDIKPANILLDDDGHAYLADFGIAKNLDDSNQGEDTVAGALIGSPAYISPEQILSGPVQIQTDIYCFGLVVYEMLTGQRPFPGATPLDLLQQQLHMPTPPASESNPNLPAAVDQVINRATAKQVNDRYTDIQTFLAAFQQAVDSIAEPYTFTPVDFELENPYKGLRPFSETDADDFFGRETSVQSLLGRMAEADDTHCPHQEIARFLAIIGPSGSGKSSLVRAGLIPALRRGGLPGSDHWFITTMTPNKDPLAELATALLRISTQSIDNIHQQLQATEQGLETVLSRILPTDARTELVLLVDQFEELFAPTVTETARTHFLNSLVTAVHDPNSRLRVIVTLRADYLDRPLQYVNFGEFVQQRSELIVPLTSDELEQAIRGPAARVGLQLDTALVKAIMHDLAGQPGALPLLQYTLTELFEQRQEQRLTITAYDRFDGISGALTKRAESIFQTADSGQQALMRQLFLRLVTVNQDAPDTRRRVPLAEMEGISADAQTLLAKYEQHRLLTFDREPTTRQPTVEIAHEALLTGWERLHTWIQNARDDLQQQRLLAAAAGEWEAANRDPSYLLRDARLAHFWQWRPQSSMQLTQQEDDFLTISQAAQAARQARQRRNRRLLRGLQWSTAVAGVIALIFAVVAWQQRNSALENLNQSEAQRLAAESNRLLLKGSDSEVAALLAMQSHQRGYTPQGDEALVTAAQLNYPMRLLTGHTDNVRQIQFWPDGSRLVSGSDDGVPRIWDAQTGELLLTLEGQTSPAYGVTLSPDGNLIASSDAEAMLVHIWDAETGEQIQQIAHAAEIWTLQFSPDGRSLLTGDFSGAAHLWDITSGDEIQTFEGHDDIILSVAFDPSGDRIITGSGDTTAKIWDVATGEAQITLSGHIDWAWAVAFSPDGRQAAVGSWDKTATLWDSDSGELLLTLSHDAPVFWECVAFSPDGRFLLTGGQDNSAHVWDIQTGIERYRFSHSTTVSGVAFAPDGQTVATGSYDQTIRLWNLNAAPRPAQFPPQEVPINDVAFSPDGTHLLASLSDGTVRTFSAQTGVETSQLMRAETVMLHSAFSPDGRFIAASSVDNIVSLWDSQSGSLLHEMVGHTQLVQCCVTFSPDGRLLLSSSMDGTARLWDLETGAQLQQFDHPQDLFTSAFSPDGTHIYTGSCDAKVHVWETTSQTETTQFTLPGSRHCIHTLAVSPNGTQLAVGSVDGLLLLLDAKTGDVLQELVGHTDVVWDVAFSPDGQQIVSGSADRTARLWRSADGVELRRFAGHTGVIWGVDFAPDGRSIATASDDGTIRLWFTDLNEVIADLCKRLPRDLSAPEREQYHILLDAISCP